MFARSARIRTSGDIRRSFRYGRRHNTPLFRFWVYKRQAGSFRATVLCSRKVDKRATRRNLLKRRARAAIVSELKPRFEGYDIVLEIKPGVTMTTQEAREALSHVLIH